MMMHRLFAAAFVAVLLQALYPLTDSHLGISQIGGYGPGIYAYAAPAMIGEDGVAVAVSLSSGEMRFPVNLNEQLVFGISEVQPVEADQPVVLGLRADLRLPAQGAKERFDYEFLSASTGLRMLSGSMAAIPLGLPREADVPVLRSAVRDSTGGISAGSSGSIGTREWISTDGAVLSDSPNAFMGRGTPVFKRSSELLSDLGRSFALLRTETGSFPTLTADSGSLTERDSAHNAILLRHNRSIPDFFSDAVD
jgi:hypothetical protein